MQLSKNRLRGGFLRLAVSTETLAVLVATILKPTAGMMSTWPDAIPRRHASEIIMQKVTHAFAEIAGTMHGSAQYLLEQFAQHMANGMFSAFGLH